LLPPASGLPRIDERKFLELAESFPEAAIIESFKVIEDLLSAIGTHMKLPRPKNLRAIIDELHRREMIDSATRDLFNTLREARNAAAHAGGNKRITPGEAVEYADHTDRLSSRLHHALGYFQARPDK
jgi:Domain of unknown function (DUF4145)